jgi:hypothetical protein
MMKMVHRRDQLVVAQVFQQLLAVLAVRSAAAVAEVVFAQDDVVGFLASWRIAVPALTAYSILVMPTG